ncbi:MAG: ABC transporter substrate-binding protein [Anaerolineae bacterium]|nr:ABC transporter substrate-binding protein [Anaerolineae bacterium]
MNRKLYRITIGVIVLALLITVLPGAVNAQGAKPGKDTLVIAQSVDVGTLEPSNVNSRSEANIFAHLYGTLYEIDEKGTLVPYLAKAYKYSEDGKSMTFTLNDGLTCDDGEALTAEDVAYTFERAADKNNKFTGNTAGFVLDALGYAGAKADDKLNVTIMMKAYQSIALGLISEVYIHCKDSYSKMSLDEAAKKPIGSGPYKFVEWKKDDYLLMQKVPNFTLRPATFDKIYWRVIPEGSTRVAELIAGNVDIIANVPPDQSKAIDGSGKAKVQPVAGTRRMYVGYNFKSKFAETPGGKAIQQKEVRVALQYAVDVPTICKTLLGTECTRASSMVNPPNDNPNLKPYPYDPKKAEELLDAAGYKKDANGVRFEVTLQGPRGRYLNDANVVQAIGQYLTDVGVKTNVELIDWANYRTVITNHDVGPLFFLGTGGGTWNAIYDMADISEPTGATNYTEWPNPDWFKLWNSLSDIRDPKKEREVINQMLEIMYNDPPWLFLYFQPDFYAASTRINWQARRDEQVIVYGATLK